MFRTERRQLAHSAMATGGELFSVEVRDHVAVVTMCAVSGKFPWGTPKAEHRWNPVTIEALGAALDTVEGNRDAHALVLAASGKYWSNGFDLAWADQASASDNARCNRQLNDVMARVLCFPIPTVAAIGGHWCAAGGMMGLCFDFRVMSSDRGYFFIPGVDLGLVYSPFQTELMKAKLPRHMHRDVIVLNARRWKAVELLAEKVVDEACPVGSVLPRAAAAAQRLSAKGRGPARKALQGIKRRVFAQVIAAMSSDPEMLFVGREKGVAYAPPPKL
eukprot:TRINITY_DN66851_c0_g1_i1.p2 TRINITY_DN66851_c0_g1~~TRINITY_DN66851_c0_g1_i1.p2  ORF type:complete len:275 (+),score=68.83 TRINITY_DN66851_c0_g1_i1:36-860(+)